MNHYETAVRRFFLDKLPFLEARTSGSTGIPKEIRLPRETVLESARRTNVFFGITSESRLHSCVSAEYIGGKMMLVRALLAGASYSSETPSNRPLAEIGAGERIDLLAVVPSMMWHIVGHKESGKLPKIENIIVGGSAIPATLKQRIADSGLNAYETYGMTETASHIALSRITRDESIFFPLEGISASADDRGCLLITLPDMEPIATNDIAEINGDGSFRIIGRIDNVIVTGAKKVFPEEVERKIEDLISRSFIISSRPHPKWGAELILLIEGTADDKFTQYLREQMQKRLRPEERPHDIIFINSLPRTASGKIKR